MFYACVAILLLVIIICTCTIMSAVDLERYNFGLYIILLCIVGTMIACAVCIANPNTCRNPAWYTRFCTLLQEFHPELVHIGSTSQGADHITLVTSINSSGNNTSNQLRNGNREASAMLVPAVHIIHRVEKGMAWLTENISEEKEGITSSKMDATTSEYSLRRLSVIIESSDAQTSASIRENAASEERISASDITL